jgi:hypothetical protein
MEPHFSGGEAGFIYFFTSLCPDLTRGIRSAEQGACFYPLLTVESRAKKIGFTVKERQKAYAKRD